MPRPLWTLRKVTVKIPGGQGWKPDPSLYTTMNSIKFPPLSEQPPWYIMGGSEQQDFDHAWRHYDADNDCLVAHYQLHAQIPLDQLPTQMMEGDSFTIYAMLNCYHPTDGERTAYIYCNNGSTPEKHTPTIIQDGINLISTKGIFNDNGGDIVLTIGGKGTIHLQVVSVIITFEHPSSILVSS